MLEVPHDEADAQASLDPLRKPRNLCTEVAAR